MADFDEKPGLSVNAFGAVVLIGFFSFGLVAAGWLAGYEAGVSRSCDEGYVLVGSPTRYSCLRVDDLGVCLSSLEPAEVSRGDGIAQAALVLD